MRLREHLLSLRRPANPAPGRGAFNHPQGCRQGLPAVFLPVLVMARLAAIVIMPSSAMGQTVSVYTNRSDFLQAAGAAAVTDDYHAYPLGPIIQGATLGDFAYSFNPSATLPAVVPDGAGGKLLGGSPYAVFVGGDVVSLTLAVTNPASGDRLRAFGGDVVYAPSASGVLPASFRITIQDGTASNLYAANSLLTGDPGSFFLGFITSPGAEFTSVAVGIVQPDPNTLVPACQVGNLVYLKVAPNPPQFTAVNFQAGNVVLQGGGGMADSIFYLRASTNVAAPMSQWPRILTNYFRSDGGFAVTNLIDPAEPWKFYRLEIP